MDRILKPQILDDLTNKIVLVMGPRQCGKTTLAKKLMPQFEYLNYDSAADRLILGNQIWDRAKPLIIFDELHKMKNWKQWLKGIYDTEGIPPQYLVTGSARLDTYRKMGDSLAGRYFSYRLHPLDLKEAILFLDQSPDQLFNTLWHCSGFPEPFLKNNEAYYKRWRRTHLDIILRQDLLDLYTVKNIQGIETLVEILKTRIGSSISYANLARDLEVDPTTVKRWLGLLENLYIIFKVSPYSKNIARSLLKEPKYYFYDHTYAGEDKGARLENIVACALLKELQYIEDTTGKSTELHYLRTNNGKELDFLICMDSKATHLIEVKYSDTKPSPHFKHFSAYFPQAKCIQLVKMCARNMTHILEDKRSLTVAALIPWLSTLILNDDL